MSWSLMNVKLNDFIIRFDSSKGFKVVKIQQLINGLSLISFSLRSQNVGPNEPFFWGLFFFWTLFFKKLFFVVSHMGVHQLAYF